MKHSDTITKIATAFVKAAGEFKTVAFDAENPHFKNKYASLHATVDAVRPILAKHGLAVLQGTVAPDATEGVLTMFAVETMLLHESGEWMSNIAYVPMEKPTAQAAGSGLSYGRRYGLQALLSLVTDDDDGETASDHPQHPRAAATPAPARSPAPAATAGRGKVMPFGRSKGTAIADLPESELLSAIDWCGSDAEKALKFKDLIAALRAEQKARLTVRPGKETPSAESDEPEVDDDLPF